MFFKSKYGGQREESSQNECVLVKRSYPFQDFTHLISVHSFYNIVLKEVDCAKGRDHLIDW